MGSDEIKRPGENESGDTEPVSLTTLMETMDGMGFEDPIRRAVIISLTYRLHNERKLSIDYINAFLKLQGPERFLERFLPEFDNQENSPETRPVQAIPFRRKSSTTMTAVIIPPTSSVETIETQPISMIPTSNDLLANIKLMRETVEGALDQGRNGRAEESVAIIDDEKSAAAADLARKKS